MCMAKRIAEEEIDVFYGKSSKKTIRKNSVSFARQSNQEIRIAMVVPISKTSFVWKMHTIAKL